MLRIRPVALVAVLVAACAASAPVLAQTPTNVAAAVAPASNSRLDAELFYQLLLGELNAQGSEPAAG